MYNRSALSPGAYKMPTQQPAMQTGPNVPGVLSQMPYMTAHNWRLGTRGRDIDAAVEGPNASPVSGGARQQSRIFQGQDGTWYYTDASGTMRATEVIHNPQTGKAFYWDGDARDFLPAE